MDYIEFVHSDSVNRKYKIIHLSAFPFLTGELNSPICNDMKSKIKEKQYFINLVHKKDLYTFNKPYIIAGEDNHPTEHVHELYANQVVKLLL